MASFDLLTWNGSTLKTKRVPSSSSTLDFLSVKVGSSGLEIKQTGSDFDFAAKKLTNIVAGTSAGHAVEYAQLNSAISGLATTSYVDSVAQGLKPKAAVRAGTTAAIDLSTDLVNNAVIDSVTVLTGDRVLVKNQALPEENGIYIVAASGPAARATDMDSLSPINEVMGAYTFIQEGGQAGQAWVQYGAVVTLGVSPITFTFFNSVGSMIGGDMIAVVGPTISVDVASVSGLESSNPGNVGGQLRIKLEASNPTLHINGSNQIGVKLDSAGALSTGASGLKILTGDGVKLSGNAVVADYAKSFTNDNAGTVTALQVVIIKANGHFDLAKADSASDDFELGLIQDSSIGTGAAGLITVRRGAIVGGFSGLTPGKHQFVSRATAGELVEDLTGFVAGEFVFSAGKAVSATESAFNPKLIMYY